jgi:hypothetical protein
MRPQLLQASPDDSARRPPEALDGNGREGPDPPRLGPDDDGENEYMFRSGALPFFGFFWSQSFPPFSCTRAGPSMSRTSSSFALPSVPAEVHDDVDWNPLVWGPAWWTVLHLIARTYPLRPDSIIRRETYHLFTHLPLFLPSPAMAAHWAQLLDRYPLSAYLSSRADLVAWVHFMHNQINRSLGRAEPTLAQCLQRQAEQFETTRIRRERQAAWQTRWAFLAGSLALVGGLYISLRPG